eukprot:TRINITY_DN13853_c0_g1_i2.p1 TRINITY_DN13853_c0_g1~~TRINITY_DN13853_c0_g1_i2.p1  ORF type:complete len:466 (+),score=70.22 TRINITY_DN13853_c0_g1_i2:53-1399(+)
MPSGKWPLDRGPPPLRAPYPVQRTWSERQVPLMGPAKQAVAVVLLVVAAVLVLAYVGSLPRIGTEVTVIRDCAWVGEREGSRGVKLSHLCGMKGYIVGVPAASKGAAVFVRHQGHGVVEWPLAALQGYERAFAVLEWGREVPKPAASGDATALTPRLGMAPSAHPQPQPLKLSSGTASDPSSSPPRSRMPVLAPRPLAHTGSAHLLHIPKAGGTAFTTAIRAVVGCSRQPCLGDMKKHPPCPQMKGCYGHDPFRRGDWEAVADGTVALAVVNVRRPVTRVISAFNHGRRELPCCGLIQREPFKSRLYKSEGRPDAMSLREFAEHGTTQNCMTKMLAGKQCKDEVTITPALLQAAKEAVSRFHVVLIQEYVEESLNLMTCVTGTQLTDPAFSAQVRPGVYTERGSDSDRQFIAAANDADDELYDETLLHFCALYSRHECSFALPAGLCR